MKKSNFAYKINQKGVLESRLWEVVDSVYFRDASRLSLFQGAQGDDRGFPLALRSANSSNSF